MKGEIEGGVVVGGCRLVEETWDDERVEGMVAGGRC